MVIFNTNFNFCRFSDLFPPFSHYQREGDGLLCLRSSSDDWSDNALGCESFSGFVKSDLVVEGFSFNVGDVVLFEMGLGINGQNLWFLDVESDCYETSPGVRLGLINGELVFDRSKIGYGTDYTGFACPQNQYVNIKLYMHLGETTQILVENVEVYKKEHNNFPDQNHLKNLGVNCVKPRYKKAQVGLTATNDMVKVECREFLIDHLNA